MDSNDVSIILNDTGIPTRYLAGGHDSLIILSHGFGGKAVAFMPLAQMLAKDHDIIVYAHRGHGFSDTRDDYRTEHLVTTDKRGIAKDGRYLIDTLRQYSIEKSAEDLGALVNQFRDDYKKVGLFGFSSGATAAAYASDNVDAVYLASPFMSTDDIRYLGHFSKLLTPLNGLNLEDKDIKVPVRAAIAENDHRLLSNEKVQEFQERFGTENVKVFKGNHCFNPGNDELYFGKSPDIHKELYSDIVDFFTVLK